MQQGTLFFHVKHENKSNGCWSRNPNICVLFHLLVLSEVTMLDNAISVSSTCCRPCTWEFIIKKLIYRHYLLHQNVVVTLECGLHIIFTFHLPNPIFSLQALPPTSFTTFLTHGWTSMRTPTGNIAIPLRKIEVINLKGPHVMPG